SAARMAEAADAAQASVAGSSSDVGASPRAQDVSRVTARIVPDGDDGRAAAVETLRAGGIVALPTDTVYGIAVALGTPGGIERLFRAKQRPPDRGVMLLLEDSTQAAGIGVMGPAASALATAL